jgi:outer membrane protein OmpA-like peptidoglycan-associated protein
MRKLFTFLFVCLLFISSNSFAQLRVAFVEGGHQSTVLEQNNLSNWNDRKDSYSARTGAHFGIMADIPVSKRSHASLQPGVIYYNKGRKYAQQFDTLTSQVLYKNATQYTNYVDVPFNLVFKVGHKVKFTFGGGPYASLFYNGKESSQTVFQGSVLQASENKDVPVGDAPGQYKIFNWGANALAGFEVGRVFFTANYSRGLNDFYTANGYSGKFKHQVIGVTLGIFIGKPIIPEKRIKDKDKDGIADDKDACPKNAGSAATNGCPDKDGDGIIDKDDSCPDVAGLAANKGCPILDRDNDGVNDKEDNCPDIAGTKKYNGCPVPDSDKDGIDDEKDKCPDVAGLIRYGGCPVPDSDGDGVNDEQDKCPNVKGAKEKGGCPVAAAPIKKEIVEKVSYAAKRIQFKAAQDDLLPQSYKVLDDVSKILTDNPELNLSIEGHTNTDGIYEANMKLSQQRADKVKAYLISKGIDADRLKAKGFGPTKPLYTGRSESEKSQNRRVELKLSN